MLARANRSAATNCLFYQNGLAGSRGACAPTSKPMIGEARTNTTERAGHGSVEGVGALAGLEKGIGVVRGAAHKRPLRVERAGAMGPHEVIVDHGADLRIVEKEKRVQLVAGAETIEEMQERNARGQRGDLRHQRRVVRLLHRAGRQQREAGAPGTAMTSLWSPKIDSA